MVKKKHAEGKRNIQRETKRVDGNKKKTSIGKETSRWKINIHGEKET